MSGTSSDAKRDANVQVLEQLKELREEEGGKAVGVLCPQCNDFTPDAAARYLPRGVQAGILNRIEKGVIFRERLVLFVAIPIAIILAIPMLFFVIAGDISGMLILGGISAIVIVLPSVGVWLLMRILNRPAVALAKAKLAKMSSQQIGDFVKYMYYLSGGSLELECLSASGKWPMLGNKTLIYRRSQFTGETSYSDGKSFLNVTTRVRQCFDDFEERVRGDKLPPGFDRYTA